MSGPRAGPRSRARQAAVQALYQWQLTSQPAADIAAEFVDDERLERVDVEYFDRMLRGVSGASADLDELLEPILDRPVSQLDPVERAILRLGAYELAHCPDIPWRVVVNEAVDLAHVFGAEQSHRYVNGILDRLARRLRRENAGETH